MLLTRVEVAVGSFSSSSFFNIRRSPCESVSSWDVKDAPDKHLSDVSKELREEKSSRIWRFDPFERRVVTDN